MSQGTRTRRAVRDTPVSIGFWQMLEVDCESHSTIVGRFDLSIAALMLVTATTLSGSRSIWATTFKPLGSGSV